MILALDFGNTRMKAGVFHQNKLVFHEAYHKFSANDMKEIFLLFADIESCIIANVVDIPKSILQMLQKKVSVIFFNELKKLPIQNKYKTPSTLGKDRLAVSCGAVELFGKKNCLIINCGTCITYDLVEEGKNYAGGSISPGLEMRFAALQHFTQKLPLIKKKSIHQLVGNDTETSILTGVINGIVNEIESTIHQYKKKYSALKVVITGGDADFLAEHFKNRIFVAPHLTLIGLNSIIKNS